MSRASLILFAILFTLLILFERRNMCRYGKKEKAAFVALTAASAVLAVALFLFPQMPGPSQLVEAIFSPFGKLLEK